MAETTSWADDTFNPWIGCTKVSPACDGCYAAHMMGMDGRMKRVEWGEPGKGEGTRERTSPQNWRKPLKWNREAKAAGGPRFVFCASLADVFDNAVPVEWRRDLFALIAATPNLTWLLLTKRPQMIVKMFSEAALAEARDTNTEPRFDHWPSNAYAGTTVEDYARLTNVFRLLQARETLNIPLAFLSCEPLLENIAHDSLMAMLGGPGGIGWVITGGETDQGAHKARPTHPDWFRGIRDQCAAAGIPYHHKQNGEWLAGHQYTAEIAASDSGEVFSRFDCLDWVGDEACYPDELDLGEHAVYRVGKKRSGRLLDGVLHDARPT